MRQSIKTKIMIFSSALLLIVLICQVVFNMFFSKSYYIETQRKQLETLFYHIKSNYSDNVDDIVNIIKTAEEKNIKVVIFDDNSVIFSNQNLNWALPLVFPKGNEKMFMLKENFSDNPTAYISEQHKGGGQPVSNDIVLNGKFEYNGTTRYISFALKLEEIENSASLFTQTSIVISIVVLAAGLIASFIFAKKFSKPIKNIEAVAKNISNLNFEFKADENVSGKEINSLALSVNSMSSKLESTITELKIANEKLQKDVDYQKQIEKMRREFVANVSHEMKTPLCLLMMYSEGLKDNIDLVDKDYYCNTIIEESQKLNEMVKSMLDISAVENGLYKMNKKSFSLTEMCTSLSSKMKPLLDDFNFETKIEQDIQFNGDEQYIEQAAKNYLSNAINHTQQGGRISLSLENCNGHIIYSVYNDGANISDDDMAHIWESFYKTDKARSRGDEIHAGLGLYIVKTIIEEHGGKCGIDNLENGVKFWFEL